MLKELPVVVGMINVPNWLNADLSASRELACGPDSGIVIHMAALFLVNISPYTF